MANNNLREVLKKLTQKTLNWVKSNCVNNLLSTATNLPLAAAQGKVLDEKIDEITQSLSDSKLITDGSVSPQNISLGTTLFEHDGWLYADISVPYDFSYANNRLFISNTVSNYRVAALGLVKSTAGNQETSIWIPIAKGQSLKITQMLGNSVTSTKTSCVLYFYHN